MWILAIYVGILGITTIMKDISMKHTKMMALLIGSLFASQAAMAKYYVVKPVTGLPVPVANAKVDGQPVQNNATFTFGAVDLGATSSKKTVSISYNGTDSIFISPDTFNLSQNWKIENNRCSGAYLGMGNPTCAFDVKYSPVAASTVSESIAINVPNKLVLNYTFTGTGNSPVKLLNTEGIGSASSNSGDVPAAFDGNDSTSWSAFGAAGQGITRWYTTPITLTSLKVKAWQSGGSWRVYVRSADNADWQVLGTYSTSPTSDAITIPVNNLTVKQVYVASTYPYNDVASFTVYTLDIYGIK